MPNGSSACPRRGRRHSKSTPAKTRRCAPPASNSCWRDCMPAIGSRARRSMGGLRMKTDKFIHDRGRGPEIKGTRITVYSILDYMIEGWHCERIAEFFQLHPQQVLAAMKYVRKHTLEVLREYVKILERCERGNPPEIQAKLEASHKNFKRLMRKVQAA